MQYVSRVRLGTSFSNWLLPSPFKRPLVVLLEAPVLTFRQDFGSRIINRGERRVDEDVSSDSRILTVTQGWRRDLFSFLKHRDWIRQFVWSIEMTDLIVRSSHFEMSIDSGFYEYKWDSHTLVLNNSCVKSLFPLTVDDINSDSPHHRTLHVSLFRFTLNRIQNEHHYVFKDEIYGQWSPVFHLNAMNVFYSIRSIIRKLKNSQSNQQTASNDRPALLYFQFSGRISIGCLLSNEGQTMELRAADFSFVKPAKQRFSLKSNSIVLFCDEKEIATFDVSILQLFFALIDTDFSL